MRYDHPVSLHGFFRVVAAVGFLAVGIAGGSYLAREVLPALVPVAIPVAGVAILLGLLRRGRS